jgi:hypothetical protein
VLTVKEKGRIKEVRARVRVRVRVRVSIQNDADVYLLMKT